MKLSIHTPGRIQILASYVTCYECLRSIRARRGPDEGVMIDMILKMVKQEQMKWLELITNDKDCELIHADTTT